MPGDISRHTVDPAEIGRAVLETVPEEYMVTRLGLEGGGAQVELHWKESCTEGQIFGSGLQGAAGFYLAVKPTPPPIPPPQKWWWAVDREVGGREVRQVQKSGQLWQALDVYDNVQNYCEIQQWDGETLKISYCYDYVPMTPTEVQALEAGLAGGARQ
jgi:hypothetical protein